MFADLLGGMHAGGAQRIIRGPGGMTFVYQSGGMGMGMPQR